MRHTRAWLDRNMRNVTMAVSVHCQSSSVSSGLVISALELRMANGSIWILEWLVRPALGHFAGEAGTGTTNLDFFDGALRGDGNMRCDSWKWVNSPVYE